MGGERYTFTEHEVADARSAKVKLGNPLNMLYRNALSYDLNKIQLLHELFSEMIENAVERTANPQRPIVAVLHRVIKLAAGNYQPVSGSLWRQNQATGYFGPLSSADRSEPTA